MSVPLFTCNILGCSKNLRGMNCRGRTDLFWTVASKKQEKTVTGFCPSRKTQDSCESLAITVGDTLEGLTVEKKKGCMIHLQGT